MRQLRIFFLQLQNVIENRARVLVWFIIAFLNPLMALLFWQSAIASSDGRIGEFTLDSIRTYYFLLIVANLFLIVYVEDTVSVRDIKEGGLVKYLLKPVSYFWMKFHEELSFKLTKSIYAVLILLGANFIFYNSVKTVTNPLLLLLAMFIIILAYMVSFTFKMCVGLVAFWIIDTGGFFQFIEVTTIIFSGMVIPISLMDKNLQLVSNLLPFSYIIYYPIQAFVGNLTIADITKVISMQIIWLFIFYLIYKVLWRRGLMKFSAVGQ